MKERLYYIRGKWDSDSMSPAVIGARFLDTLDRLSSLKSPVMGNWLVSDQVTPDPLSIKAIPLMMARPNMTALVEKGVKTDDDDKPDPDLGYWIFARGGEVESEFGRPRSADLHVSAGSSNDNRVEFRIGSDSEQDLTLVTYPVFRDALEILASVWPCPYVEARLYQPIEQQFIPNAMPDHSSALERLDPDDPEHLRRTRLLQWIVAERTEPPASTPYWAWRNLPARVGPF